MIKTQILSGLGQGLFYCILNSTPLTRDVTCSVTLLGQKNMRRQCQMNTLFKYDRSFALMANNRRKSKNTWRASYSDLTLHWLGGWVSKLTSIWWGKEQIVQVKVFNAISHLLTNFEIQRYDQNEHQFNIQEIFFLKKYSRNNSLDICICHKFWWMWKSWNLLPCYSCFER